MVQTINKKMALCCAESLACTNQEGTVGTLFNFQLVNAKEVKVNKIWHSVPLPMPLQPHEPHEANGKKSKSMMLC